MVSERESQTQTQTQTQTHAFEGVLKTERHAKEGTETSCGVHWEMRTQSEISLIKKCICVTKKQNKQKQKQKIKIKKKEKEKEKVAGICFAVL